jgi:hypothetical protein
MGVLPEISPPERKVRHGWMDTSTWRAVVLLDWMIAMQQYCLRIHIH